MRVKPALFERFHGVLLVAAFLSLPAAVVAVLGFVVWAVFW